MQEGQSGLDDEVIEEILRAKDHQKLVQRSNPVKRADTLRGTWMYWQIS